MTEWEENQDNDVTNDALEQQFDSLSDERVDDVLEESQVALLALTERESFDMVLGAATSGLEPLRRLVRR